MASAISHQTARTAQPESDKGRLGKRRAEDEENLRKSRKKGNRESREIGKGRRSSGKTQKNGWGIQRRKREREERGEEQNWS